MHLEIVIKDVNYVAQQEEGTVPKWILFMAHQEC